MKFVWYFTSYLYHTLFNIKILPISCHLVDILSTSYIAEKRWGGKTVKEFVSDGETLPAIILQKQYHFNHDLKFYQVFTLNLKWCWTRKNPNKSWCWAWRASSPCRISSTGCIILVCARKRNSTQEKFYDDFLVAMNFKEGETCFW